MASGLSRLVAPRRYMRLFGGAGLSQCRQAPARRQWLQGGEDRRRSDRALVEPLAGGGRCRPHGAINNLVDIEVDIRDGSDGRPPKDGTIALGNLILRYGPLPPTLTASSPSGGVHRLFSYVEGVHGGTERLGSGIDVLSDGDYAVMPPSHGLYRWMDERPITELPQAWIEHRRALDGNRRRVFSPARRKHPLSRSPQRWRSPPTMPPSTGRIGEQHRNGGLPRQRRLARGLCRLRCLELKAPVLRCRLAHARTLGGLSDGHRPRASVPAPSLPCRRSRPQLARTNKPSVG